MLFEVTKVSGANRGSNPRSQRPTGCALYSYWQAKGSVARVVAKAKTQMWEDFGEGMEQDLQLTHVNVSWGGHSPH